MKRVLSITRLQPQQMIPPQQQKTVSSTRAMFKKNFFITSLLLLLVGFIFGMLFAKIILSKSATVEVPQKTIALLIYDGNMSRTWNGVSLNEGESVADVIDRVAREDNILLSWSGESRSRQISSLDGKEIGEYSWQVYLNNAPLQTSIGKFYPKPGDNISLIYTRK
jgi:hypothetical protein